MKAMVKLALPGYTGKMDDMVIYFNSKLNKLVARRYVKPAKTPSNTDFTAISKLVKTLGMAPDYIEDCRRYVTYYNQKNRRHNRALSAWTNVFYKLMLNLKKMYPDLDLATLTKDEIYANNYPCRNIALSVEAGLLDKVNDYQTLTHQL